MSAPKLNFVFLGLSITSSWGNGHATTYRALIRELCALGHDVLFLERDKPWYAQNRDLPKPPYGRTRLYSSVEELKDVYAKEVAEADAVIVGSFVPDGAEIGSWVVETARGIPAFYDIDTPVTFRRLASGEHDYLAPALVSRYALYLSFTGGPFLRQIETLYGSPKARPLYCSVDIKEYFPEPRAPRWDLGYIGTYSEDRQPALSSLLLEPAREWNKGRFIVAGPQYPSEIDWGRNVERVDHLSPGEHRRFYNGQRFTLNVTRNDMIHAGYSPSVRLFEAAGCGTPVISDYWRGLETIFEIGREILVARSPREVLRYLREFSEPERMAIGKRALARVLREHSSRHRAKELESHVLETLYTRRSRWKASETASMNRSQG